MSDPEPNPTAPGAALVSRWRIATFVAAVAGAMVAHAVIEAPIPARAAGITVFCLVLWLLEAVPVFVPTLALFVLAPVLLGSADPRFHLRPVLTWAADPVLALFFGGFVLGGAASHHRIDHNITREVMRVARGRMGVLVPMLLSVTALLSMWMSNIAAAALMIAAIAPLMRAQSGEARAALLLAVAFGANLGGMATPIGTGPNAIALASLPDSFSVAFATWMAFALPLTIAMLLAAWALIRLRYRVGAVRLEYAPPPFDDRAVLRPRLVGVLAGLTVTAWLSEPLHGVSAPIVSLLLAAVLFGSGLLPAAALRSIDWSTLILIAGGIGLGRMIELSGLLHGATARLAQMDAHPLIMTGLFVAASATLSALMSNTATATMLIPIAASVEPGRHEIPILIALAASFGMPFVISTPPNAMAVGAGLNQRALLMPGLVLMLAGCALITLTGRPMLSLLGL